MHQPNKSCLHTLHVCTIFCPGTIKPFIQRGVIVLPEDITYFYMLKLKYWKKTSSSKEMPREPVLLRQGNKKVKF